MKQNNYNSDFNNDHKTDVATLTVNGPYRKSGKKAFDWEFFVKGAGKPIPVEIYLVEDGLKFKAVCEFLAAPLIESDIQVLHEKVKTELLEQASVISGVQWEDWFEVIVKGDNSDFADSPYSALGANLHIQVNNIKRGVVEKTGRVVSINRNGVVVDFPKPTSILDVDRLHETGLRIHDRPVERAYIPATLENRQALDEVLARMSDLRTRLSSLLSDATIKDSLQDLSQHLPLLLSDQARKKPTSP